MKALHSVILVFQDKFAKMPPPNIQEKRRIIAKQIKTRFREKPGHGLIPTFPEFAEYVVSCSCSCLVTACYEEHF